LDKKKYVSKKFFFFKKHVLYIFGSESGERRRLEVDPTCTPVNDACAGDLPGLFAQDTQLLVSGPYNTPADGGGFYEGCCFVYWLSDGGSQECSSDNVDDFILEMPQTCGCIDYNECSNGETGICYESPITSQDTYISYSTGIGLPAYDEIAPGYGIDPSSCSMGVKWADATAYNGQLLCLRNYPSSCNVVPGLFLYYPTFQSPFIPHFNLPLSHISISIYPINY